MPKITPAHEAEVRTRIAAAALRVVARRGYRRATVQDVVHESGLSVGAIYTHFKGKDDLFLVTCDRLAEQGLADLAALLADGRSTAHKLAIAVRFFVDTIDVHDDAPGQITLVQAWAEAHQEPGVREMLVRRRERLVAASQMLVREGIARGEVPAWIDVEGVTRGFTALLDGLMLQRIEAGDGYRPEEIERRARAMLELLLAAGPERPQLPTT